MGLLVVNLLFTIIGLLIGTPIGWILRGKFEEWKIEQEFPNEPRMQAPLTKTLYERITIGNFILIMITIAIVVSVMAEITVQTYKTNPLLYTALGTIAGMVLIGGRRKGGDS